MAADAPPTSAPNSAQILAALKRVIDPERGQDIVSLGMVQGLAAKDGHVAFSIEVDAARGAKLEPLRREAEKAVDALPGVLSVTAVLTAEKAGAAPRQAGGHSHGHGPADRHRRALRLHARAPARCRPPTDLTRRDERRRTGA